MKSQSGMAISTILYMIIIIFGLVIMTYMSILVKNTDINREAIDKVKTSLHVGNLSNSDKVITKEYRYMQSDGTYSDWINYTNKDSIDRTVNLTTIPNKGFMGKNYDIVSTGVQLKLENGDAYLNFNGSARGNGSTNVNGFTVNTLYLEGVMNNRYGMFVSFNNTSSFLFDYDLDFSGPNATYRTRLNSSDAITLGQKFKFVVTWTTGGIYNFYLNGVKKSVIYGYATSNHAFPFECLRIALGYGEYDTSAGGYYFNGRIYDLRLSSRILTNSEAIALTSSDTDANNILGEDSAEVIYGNFIQYRDRYIEVEEETKEPITFPARYVRDYTNGSINPPGNAGNYWVEISANAYLKEGDIFHGVVVGGSYTGSYTANYYAGTENYGEAQFSAGTFTHPNGTTYNISTAKNMVSNYEGTPPSIAGSSMIMFTGSDESRFTMGDPNHHTTFLLVKYMNGKWYYNNNDGFTKTFIPNENDAIVGFFEKKSTDIGLSKMVAFKYPFVYNVALGGGISGSGTNPTDRPWSWAVNGDIVTDGWTHATVTGSPQYLQVDFGAEYPIKTVNIRHYYADGRVSIQPATYLYNENYQQRYKLNHYLETGTLKEFSSGITFLVK